MNRILLSISLAILCLFSTALFSQAPNSFKYQGLLKNLDNTAVASTSIEVEISLQELGEIVYVELHNIDTSPDGIFSINIGQGQVLTGNFESLNWQNGVSMDVLIDGEIFEESYSLQAVPYAMYSLNNSGAGQQGPQGEVGPQGPPGEVGPQGEVGETGPPGPAGTGVTIVGSVEVASDLDSNYDGNIGDMFISQSDGNGHVWNGSSFDDVGPIRGPEGPPGIDGEQGVAGEQGPPGMDGAPGPPGETGPSGTGVTIVGSVDSSTNLDSSYSGNTGDMFISQNDGHGHVWNGSSFDDVGPIRGPEGPIGPTGMDGAPGPAGADGATGLQGPPGETGPAGTGVTIVGSVDSSSNLDSSYSGNIGDMFISQDNGNGHVWNGSSFDDVGPIRGPQGPAGADGIQGATGEPGPAGLDGAPGPAGADGAPGIQGPPGETGPAGTGVTIVGSVNSIADLDAGYVGDIGDMFIAQDNGHGHVWNGSGFDDVGPIRGPQGPAGADGMQGAAGEPGPTGLDGAPGPAGADGAPGIQGPPGETGPAGTGVSIVGSVNSMADLDPGYSGDVGDMFIAQDNGHGHVWNGSGFDDVGPIRGPQGLPGNDGAQGLPGMDGADGMQGPPGMDGADGMQGPPGMDGANGMQGPPGEQGMQGEPGPPGSIAALNLGNTVAGDNITIDINGETSTTFQSDNFIDNEIQYFGLTGEQLQLINPDGSIESSVNFSDIVSLGGGDTPWEEDESIGVVNYEGIVEVKEDGTSICHLEATNLHFHGGDDGTIFYGRELLNYLPTVAGKGSFDLGGEGLEFAKGDAESTIKSNSMFVSNTSESTSVGFDNYGFYMSDFSSGAFLTLFNLGFSGDGRAVSFLSGKAFMDQADVGFFANWTPHEFPLTVKIPDAGYGIALQSEEFYGDEAITELWTPASGGLALYNHTETDDALIAQIELDGIWSPSDSKLKKNIHPMESVSSRLKNVNLYSYLFKSNSKKAIGPLAQELQVEFPILVKKVQRNNSEETLAVNYNGLSVVALQAAKEQQEVIESQAKEISQLKESLQETNSRLAELEAKLNELLKD